MIKLIESFAEVEWLKTSDIEPLEDGLYLVTDHVSEKTKSHLITFLRDGHWPNGETFNFWYYVGRLTKSETKKITLNP